MVPGRRAGLVLSVSLLAFVALVGPGVASPNRGHRPGHTAEGAADDALAAPADHPAAALPRADQSSAEREAAEPNWQTRTSPPVDHTVTRIHVGANGSATWVLQVRTRLSSDERQREYAAFQARFRANRTRYRRPFRKRIRGVVAEAANTTGRPMAAFDFRASTSIQRIPRRWGVVTYRFRWRNFAARNGRRLIVGDVFQGGFYIAANDTLEVVAPESHDIATVDPAPDDRGPGRVGWTGARDFADRRPRVVIAPASEQATTPGSASSGQGGSGESAGAPRVPDGPSPVWVGLVALLLVGTGLVAFAVHRERRSTTSGHLDADGTQGASTAEHDGNSAGATGSPGLVTDDERVLALLRDNDGTMKQAAVADELGWSTSKTSRVLSGMAEENRIEKLRLGRENVIELADAETD